MSQWLAEQFAARTVEHAADRERAVGLATEKLAAAIERGDDVRAPNLKPTVAQRLDAIARHLNDIQRNIEERERSR